MSKRKTPNRYRLYYLPEVKKSFYNSGFPATYVLHDFAANISKAENMKYIKISYFPHAKLLYTFDKHPGSFADIRQNYPELFI